jgi:hypothetical protein
MDTATANKIEEFQKRFNEGLPCRVQFPRKAVPGFMDATKTLPNPGPSEHTGWITKMWFDGKKFDFEVAYKDPLTFDKVGNVMRVPHDRRRWKSFTLCSFVHTCYFNWDVEKSVSVDKVYTRPAQTSLIVELTPSSSVDLSHAVLVKDIVPLRKKDISLEHWSLLLENIECPKRHPDCPVDWNELRQTMAVDPPCGRRSLKGIDQLGSMKLILRRSDELTRDFDSSGEIVESIKSAINSIPFQFYIPTPIRLPAKKRVFDEISVV